MGNEKVLSGLRERSFVPEKNYITIRKYSLRHCHDAIIYIPEIDKIVLAIRGQEPAKGFLWPFGGGQKIGFSMKESLRKLIKKESGLEIFEEEFIGHPVDHFWSKGPYGESVHDVGTYFTAKGKGEINPDKLHSVKLISDIDYETRRNELPHWTRAGMDRAVKRFWNMDLGETPFPNHYIDAKPFFEK